MPALREIQFTIADAVLHPAGSGSALSLVRAGGLMPQARLAVYRNNFRESLAGTLALTFPVIRRLVGADFFRQLARRHVLGHPSTSGNLIDYGDRFPAWLGRLPQTRGLPYLADVARLEWTLHEVYHARADDALDLPTLQATAPDRLPWLRLQLNAASRLLESAYPVLRIWQANQPGADDRMTVDLDEGGPCRLLVLQRDLDAEIVALAPAEHAWLAAFDRGATLEGAFEVATQVEASFDLYAALLRHMQLGSFSLRSDEGSPQ